MENLEIKDLKNPVLSWVNHSMSSDEHRMIRNVASLPCVYKHVALMPDAHLGKGSMVGSVISTKDAIIPATVGVDIGCGMAALKTPFKSGILDGKLKDLRLRIEEVIPVGFNWHRNPSKDATDWVQWGNFPLLNAKVYDQYDRAITQMGTLGGGNHFVEVCLDTEGFVWLMLHSGSRGIGNQIASYHISEAKHLHRLSDLPDPDLAYFVKGTDEFRHYWEDLQWAQQYALENRNIMMKRLVESFRSVILDGKDFHPELSVNCHHNYAEEEVHFGESVYVTRKGAINAEFGKYGIIPGSMGTKSYIVTGKGNPDSFNSCSHGAGRRMSRNKARKAFTLKDFIRQTEGVECRKSKSLIDEIPSAYKSIDEVMDNQRDLVEVVAELKQVICVKG